MTDIERAQVEKEIRHQILMEQRERKAEWRRNHKENIKRHNKKYWAKKRAGKPDLRHKPILQFTNADEFVKEWSSITEAARALNGSCGCISQCLNGRSKTALGYKWRYVNE